MQLKTELLHRVMSWVLLALLAAGQVVPVAGAADQPLVEMPDLPQLMKDCGDNLKGLIDKDKGTLLPKAVEDIRNLSKPYADNIHLNFRIAFEKARTQYHSYFECVFERVIEEMMSSSGDDTKNLFMAHAPNLTKWMTPANACLPEQKLVEILKVGGPANLVRPSLTVYNSYVDYLQALIDELAAKDVLGSNVSFEQLVARAGSLKLLAEKEVQNALVALDSSFTALKEIRRAFTMHVHFQCMLQNLELYRRSLQSLRGVVELLPPILWDASME